MAPEVCGNPSDVDCLPVPGRGAAGVEKFLGYTAYQSAGMAADALCPLDWLCQGEASVPMQAMQLGCQNLFQGEVYPMAEPSPAVGKVVDGTGTCIRKPPGTLVIVWRRL